jgi:hypothetical protein
LTSCQSISPFIFVILLFCRDKRRNERWDEEEIRKFCRNIYKIIITMAKIYSAYFNPGGCLNGEISLSKSIALTFTDLSQIEFTSLLCVLISILLNEFILDSWIRIRCNMTNTISNIEKFLSSCWIFSYLKFSTFSTWLH